MVTAQLRGQTLQLPHVPRSFSRPLFLNPPPRVFVPRSPRLFSCTPAGGLLCSSLRRPPLCSSTDLGGGWGGSNNNNNNSGGGSNKDNNEPPPDPIPDAPWWTPSLALFLLLTIGVAPALANSGSDVVWEVVGGSRKRKLSDDAAACGAHLRRLMNLRELMEEIYRQCTEFAVHLLLPHGYPRSVSPDYMEYSLWRAVQGVASQVSGVLSTQALLYAVGLGKGAIPTAAAINWVLKDGLGYLSKILLSKFGRQFDVNPKGWRLFADLLENAAHGLEILTPLFSHLFVPIGAVAGASRSAAALIQAATRGCFFAGFAVERNYAEIIAKGEAQGMISKFIGIAVGIALANHIGSSRQLTLLSYVVVTGIHMYCNLMSYRAIQLRTLNPYRASLVFSEYLLSGQCPSVKEVNDAEPLFAGFPISGRKNTDSQGLSSKAKDAAAEICHRLQLGSELSQIISSKEDVCALFQLFRNEQYLIVIHQGKFCVILKEGASPQDMLRSMFQINYLYWLEKHLALVSASVADDCSTGGRLQVSLDYANREFQHVKGDGKRCGWVTDGLIAQPLPTRIHQEVVVSS